MFLATVLTTKFLPTAGQVPPCTAPVLHRLDTSLTKTEETIQTQVLLLFRKKWTTFETTLMDALINGLLTKLVMLTASICAPVKDVFLESPTSIRLDTTRLRSTLIFAQPETMVKTLNMITSVNPASSCRCLFNPLSKQRTPTSRQVKTTTSLICLNTKTNKPNTVVFPLKTTTPSPY